MIVSGFAVPSAYPPTRATFQFGPIEGVPRRVEQQVDLARRAHLPGNNEGELLKGVQRIFDDADDTLRVVPPSAHSARRAR